MRLDKHGLRKVDSTVRDFLTNEIDKGPVLEA